MKIVELNKTAKSGDIITFGSYPQLANGKDRTPIKWQVLKNTGNEMFILSDYLLDCKRYYKEFVDITWRDSDLRKWLNEDFYQTAFHDSEKRFIKTTLCTDNGEGTPNTEDNVFLLSVNELRSLSDILGKDLRHAVGTEFAKVKKSDGCRLYVYNLKDDRNYKIENDQKHGYSWWWLRTQLGSSSRAAFVGTLASIRSYGRVNLPYYGVRPALVLDLI
jgi:hypothetical protein